MTQNFQGLATRDVNKKRRRWIDVVVSVCESTRQVTVQDIENSQSIFRGTLDNAILTKLVELEETRVGSLLIQLEQQQQELPATQPICTIGRKLDVKSRPVATKVGTFCKGGLSKPFRPPTKGSVPALPNYQAPSSSSSISSYSSSRMPSNSFPFVPSPTSASYGQSIATNEDCDIPNSSSIITTSASVSVLAMQYTLYNNPNLRRQVMVPNTFENASCYAKIMLSSCREEILFNIFLSMKSFEDRFLQRRKSVSSFIAPLSNVKSAIDFNFQLHKSSLKSMQSEGIAIMEDVQIIVPKGRTGGVDEEGSDVFNRKYLRRNCDKDVSATSSSKTIYMKIQGKFKSSNKNEIILLWLPQSRISDHPLEIWDGFATQQLRVDKELSARFIEARSKFIALRKDKGYPWPFYGGFILQDIWAIRTRWYGFSAENWMEICNLDGSVAIPPKLLRFVESKNGNNFFNGVRVSDDNQLLTAMDILRGGVGKQDQISKTITVSFGNLVGAPIFNSMLSPCSVSGKCFPVVDDDTIVSTLEQLCRDFKLNAEQIRIVYEVSAWFSQEGNKDSIMLVDGVFGSVTI